MGGLRDDQEAKQKQIKDGKMGMDEGNRGRRRKGVRKGVRFRCEGKDEMMDVKLD